jgi:hypothetical protein
MKFFNVQTGGKEAERHTTRSLRRRDRNEEAVALELEEARPTMCDHHWR